MILRWCRGAVQDHRRQWYQGRHKQQKQLELVKKILEAESTIRVFGSLHYSTLNWSPLSLSKKIPFFGKIVSMCMFRSCHMHIFDYCTYNKFLKTNVPIHEMTKLDMAKVFKVFRFLFTLPMKNINVPSIFSSPSLPLPSSIILFHFLFSFVGFFGLKGCLKVFLPHLF